MRLFLLFLLLAWSASAANYYVATNGDDATVTASIVAPAATINRALVIATGDVGRTGAKSVIVRGGNYYNVNVLLDDGIGPGINTTIQGYPGETAVLYGGQPLTSWSAAGSNGWYVASLGVFPASVSSDVSGLTDWQPRMLLVNGEWAPRARDPITNKYHFATEGVLSATYTNDFPATTNMELMVDHAWNDSEVDVWTNDTGTKTFSWDTSMYIGGEGGAVRSFAMFNTPSGMLQNNNWWWNKTNNSIILRSSVDPNTIPVVVPTTTTILYFKGLAGDHGSTNCLVSNLTFRVTSAALVFGQDDGGNQRDPAIKFLAATNITIDSCVFDGIGGVAIGRGQGSGIVYSNRVQNSIFRNIGACAVDVTGGGGCVSNNLIGPTGLICQSGTGVKGGDNVKIVSNTITNIQNAAIMVISGSGGYPDPGTIGATLEKNFIIRAMQQLKDMGAIYVQSMSNVTSFGNYISSVYGTNDNAAGDTWDGFVHGIYYDFYNGINMVAASNIVIDCCKPVQYAPEYPTTATWINNIFVDTRPAESNVFFLNHTNAACTWQRNILVAQGSLSGRTYYYTVQNVYVSWDQAVADWHNNIVWSVNGFNGTNPTNATTADPLFLKVPTTPPQYLEDADFRFGSGSPAPGLGIQPLSLEGIGYNGGLTWRRRGTATTLSTGSAVIRSP